MYAELFVPVDNSLHSGWAVERAIELARGSRGRITANHVYAARLHDVRFRQLETGLPAQFQTPEEIKKQRKIHDKLIEKGLQLIADSFLDEVGARCGAAGVPLTRQLLEGINYEEIVREVNRGEGRLPGLIGFDPNRAAGYDGAERVRGDVRVDEAGRMIAEEEDEAARLAGTSGRRYDLVVIGAHGLGRQPYSQAGGVVTRVLRGVEKDALVVRDERPLQGARIMVCVDGSSYSYAGMRRALELAREFGASVHACSAFDVEYHHVVFHNIKDVLSVQASKVFKFEEQEELHNNIIDKGLLKLCQANLKRAEAMARDFPGVPLETQILVGKPFQVILQWAEEVKPALLVAARHGAHRIDGTQMGSQAENLVRLAPCNLLLVGAAGIRPEDVPWIEEDGKAGLPWAPDAEVRILRVPPFAQGIARRAVEEYVLEQAGGETTVTNRWLDEAIAKLLPTHMQLIMGIGSAEEIARAEVKAEEQLRTTRVEGHDEDPVPEAPEVETKCPITGRVGRRPRAATDPVVWSEEAWARLRAVPLIARPLARSTVERFARGHGIWRVTTMVMDENKQAMIEADEFDAETMMSMFNELRARQIRAEAEGKDALSPEMRAFIEEAKASGVTRCPIRDIEAKMDKCPVDFAKMTPGPGEAGGRGPHREGAGLLTPAAGPASVFDGAESVDGGPFLPHVVAWNLTRRCNLACTHCYISAGPWESGEAELTTDECLRVVDQLLAANPSPLLILSGGEPLVRQDLPRIAGYAAERGATVVVGTNGTMLTDSRVRTLKEAGVSGVAVSVDSLEEERHDLFRGGRHALARTVDALARLREHRLDFVLQTTASPGNAAEIPRLVDWAAEQGAVCFNLYFLVPTGRGAGLADLPPHGVEDLLALLARAESRYRGSMMVRAKCAPHFMRHVHAADPLSPVLGYRTRCPCGIDYCRITPDGKLTPCPYMPSVAGDLRRQSFAEIWKGSPLLQELRRRELGGRCGRCEYRLVCGGCRARALATSGDHLAEDPSCTYEPSGERPLVARAATVYGATAAGATLAWSEEARNRMQRVPSFVRGVVMKRVEDFARARGLDAVTPDLLDEVRRQMPIDFSKRRPFFLGGD